MKFSACVSEYVSVKLNHWTVGLFPLDIQDSALPHYGSIVGSIFQNIHVKSFAALENAKHRNRLLQAWACLTAARFSPGSQTAWCDDDIMC